MSNLKVNRIRSIDELRSCADEWDDLWLRSEVSQPSVRAEPLADWVEHFQPTARFTALTVEQDGCLLAALPLIEQRVAPLVKLGEMPSNSWESCGDLLVDSSIDSSDALDRLVAEFGRLRWTLLWLSWLRPDTARWQSLRAALDRAGLGWEVVRHYGLGVLDVNGDWEKYLASRSSKLRSQLRRVSRRLEEDGGGHTRFFSTFDGEDVTELVRRGFEVEDRSWKGAEGTSVVRTPGMLEYFTRRAQWMAERGHLELAFLEHKGQPIAFAFALAAKGVYHAIKIGYDEEFARYSPGVILRGHLLERLFRAGTWHTVQFNGPVMNQATRRWSTHSEVVGRVVIAPRRYTSRAALWAYRCWRTRVRGDAAEDGDQSDSHDEIAPSNGDRRATASDHGSPAKKTEQDGSVEQAAAAEQPTGSA